MLKFLCIENIAIIEKSEIEFTDGFNVMTGETGAGKSIIIDAINAVLGQRTSRELIRNGCESGSVTAVFSCDNEQSVKKLSENGYAPDENGEITVKRVMYADGKGNVRINAAPATVGVLKEISGCLINIHGQHDNQGLLQPDNHISYIDNIAENSKYIEEYKQEFKNLNSIRKQLNELETDEDEKIRRLDYLKYEINEIENANIKVGEYESLKEKFEIAKNLKAQIRLLENIEALFFGGDDTDGALLALQNVLTLCKNLKIAEIDDGLNDFADAVSGVENFSNIIKKVKQSFENGDYDEEKTGDRLALIKELVHKYGGSEESLFERYEEAKKQLKTIAFSEQEIERLGDELALSEERLIKKAENLTKTRIKTAEKFAKDVTEVLKYLNMPDARFEVSVKKGKYTKNGCDNVEFLISANAGEDVKPLVKIASGGELSRVMLAIKSIIADKDDTQTLIFDEIDTGISGFAAEKVGNQLQKLSKSRQVICVTHLAQIASKADTHLLINKKNESGRTLTDVSMLDTDGKVYELARILGGRITDITLKNAKEMLNNKV